MKIFDGLHGFLWTSASANNCNAYLIDGAARILIDPGHLRLFEHVERGLEEIGIGLADIDLVIVTHAHPDHLEAVKLIKERSSALFAINETDWNLVTEMSRYLPMSQGFEAVTPDFFLREGDLAVKDIALRVVPAPGHSPGSVCIHWSGKKALFTGDVLFKDGLGRTDLPGGDGSALKASIRRLSTLDLEWVLPGHGGFVSGADEVRINFTRVEQAWFAYI
ncbi:MAG: MBL fold metallo-hydrolase [Acidobacteriota bacterium]